MWWEKGQIRYPAFELWLAPVSKLQLLLQQKVNSL